MDRSARVIVLEPRVGWGCAGSGLVALRHIPVADALASCWGEGHLADSVADVFKVLFEVTLEVGLIVRTFLIKFKV
jgi:hypothetical protein